MNIQDLYFLNSMIEKKNYYVIIDSQSYNAPMCIDTTSNNRFIEQCAASIIDPAKFLTLIHAATLYTAHQRPLAVPLKLRRGPLRNRSPQFENHCSKPNSDSRH